MKISIQLRIVLETPPAGVAFGVQEGSGAHYKTIQILYSNGNDLHFLFPATVKLEEGMTPVFLGPYVHGTPAERFVYIDIGSAAGQPEPAWHRRLKVPLRNITSGILKQLLADENKLLEIKIPGTGKDNTPACGTVKPFPGWYVTAVKQ